MIKVKQDPNIYEHLEHALKTTYAQRLQLLEDMDNFFAKWRKAEWFYPAACHKKKRK